VTVGLAALEARAGVGPNHPDVAEMCSELGRIHLADQSLKKATFHFERAWHILRTVHGKAAPETLIAQEELAMALHQLGEHMRADALLNAAMQGFEKLTRRQTLGAAVDDKAKREREQARLGKTSAKPGSKARVGGGGASSLWQRAVGGSKELAKQEARAGAAAGSVGGGASNAWRRAMNSVKGPSVRRVEEVGKATTAASSGRGGSGGGGRGGGTLGGARAAKFYLNI